MFVRHIHRSPSLSAAKEAAAAVLPAAAMNAAYDDISSWRNYAPTPIYKLSASADKHRIQALYYKDEGQRFGLDSFKALGGAYALKQLLAAHVAAGGNAADFTATAATDGNHGRAIAWGARSAGCHAKIFVHENVSAARVNAIAASGADVIRINGTYDDSLHACNEQAQQNGWHVISDTSWEGYTETPRLVMAGYTVIMREIQQQLASVTPTHVFLQAGVGAFAASIAAALLASADVLPRIVIVESEFSDCLLQSAAANKIVSIPILQETLMAGLSCGEPSLLAWQILAAAASDFIAISDGNIGKHLRELAEAGIIAGECATAGFAVLSAAEDAQREALELDENSIVLLFGSEGATDKQSYQRLINNA